MTTFIAISGPPFETVIVYVTGLPAVTVAGPILVTETSTNDTVTASVPLLFSVFGSFDDEIVAVFENTVPDGVPGGICPTSV